MSIELIEAIGDVIVYCVCPLILLVDFSYGSLAFDKVFALCNKLWKDLNKLTIGETISKLPEWVTGVFNEIYGLAHFSKKCILRSLVSSIFAMGAVFFVANAIDLSGLGSHNSIYHIRAALRILGERLGTSPAVILVFSVLANLVIDYFSLLETRFVLSRIGKGTVPRTILLGIIDYLATTLLWLGGFYLLVRLGNNVGGPGAIPFARTETIWQVIFFPFSFIHEYLTEKSIASAQGVPVGHLLGIFSFSTYFTSFIFYIFSISTISLRILRVVQLRVVGILKHYGEKKKPRPLTLLAIALAAVTEGIVALIKLVSKL